MDCTASWLAKSDFVHYTAVQEVFLLKTENSAKTQKSISVIWKTVLIFSVICIVPMLTFIAYIYSLTSREIKTNARNSLNQSLTQTRDIVGRQMEQIQASCEEMVGSNLLTEFLDTRYNATGSEIIYFTRTVYPFFELRKNLLPNVYSIWIYTSNATIPNSWKYDVGIAPIGYFSSDLAQKPANLDYWWEAIHDSSLPVIVRDPKDPGPVFTYISVIRSPLSGSPIGYVNYQIAAVSLFQAVLDQENNASGQLYLVGSDGTVLLSRHPDAVGHTLADRYGDGEQDTLFNPGSPDAYRGESADYIVDSAYFPDLDCSIVAVRSLTDIGQELNRVTMRMAAAMLLACLIVIGLISLAAFGIMKRIRKLSLAMDSVDQGGRSIAINPGPPDEFGRLIKAYNDMIAKISELINNVYTTKIREKEAQLRALEAQVNPHFLYNTLTSIAYAAKENSDYDTYKMALSLGKFYRLGLSKKTELITVSDELEYLNMYLTIENIRFKDRVNYVFDIDQQYLNCKLIRNVLQPLVENAISHGLKDKLEGGIIKIRLTGEAKNLLFEVSDNGAGMSSGLLDSLNQGAYDSAPNTGYGLKNVNDRLQIYYGDHYRLHAESQTGCGTSIFVRIPIIR